MNGGEKLEREKNKGNYLGKILKSGKIQKTPKKTENDVTHNDIQKFTKIVNIILRYMVKSDFKILIPFSN